MWESCLRRCSLQHFELIVKVIATGLSVIVMHSIIMMGVIFKVKEFVVMVAKVWDLEEVFNFSIRAFIDYNF